jgi:transcriptional regulator with XRE-family HTH domain
MQQAKIVINKDYILREMKRRDIKSINELAREIGISRSMLNLIMRNKRNPGPKVITTMLAYFNVNFEKIFTEVLTKVHDSA